MSEQLDLVVQCGVVERRNKEVDRHNAEVKMDLAIAMALTSQVWSIIQRRQLTEGDLIIMSELVTEINMRIGNHITMPFDRERENVIYTNEFTELRERALRNFNELETKLKQFFNRE